MAESGAAGSAAILQMAGGLWLSRALWLAARLGIADAIGDTAVSLEDLAQKTGTHAPSLGRLMTALVAFGVFQGSVDKGFEHGRISRLLRSDHPFTQRAFIESVFGEEHYEAWGMAEAALRSDKTAFEARYGKPLFDYLAEHPQSAQLFGEAMTGTTRAVEEAVLAAHDFGRFDLGVDVGGSEGSLLRALLARTPGAQGIVFDLPATAAAGQAMWETTAEALRMTAAGGDFFEAVPAGGDLYLLKFILHDWDDARSRLILSNIRRAIRADGRVVIVEMVLPEDVTPHAGWLMDLNMLVMTGGKERRVSDYAALLDATGFKIDTVVPTASPMSVIIANPV